MKKIIMEIPKNINHNSVQLKKIKTSFVSKFIIILFNTSGIGLSWQKYKPALLLLKCYLIFSFTMTTLSQIILLKECKTMHELALTLAYIFSAVFLNISTLILHQKKQNIVNILDLTNNEIPAIMSRNQRVITADEKFRNFFFSHAIAYYVIYVFACMSPLLFLPISGNKLGDTNTLLIPSWFPWKINTVLRYVLTIALQFSWLGPLSVPVMLNFTFVVYFIIEVKTQFEILYKDILEVKMDSRECKNDKIDLKFRKCIRHYQTILKFVGNFCSCYKWLFTADLIYSLANLSLLLYGIVLGERTVSAFMQQLSAFVLVFSFLFLFCFIGETLERAISLYDIEWFQQSVKFRKTFFIFMGLTQRCINLLAGSDHVASYELFFSVVKMAYSYFNVLTTTFSR